MLHFENRGNTDTPIIEDIQTADITLDTNDPHSARVLHQLHGDSCGEKSFAPFDTELGWPGQSITMAPNAGRPSNSTAFPFFDFEYEGRGVIAGHRFCPANGLLRIAGLITIARQHFAPVWSTLIYCCIRERRYALRES